jgi:hypothetical protein
MVRASVSRKILVAIEPELEGEEVSLGSDRSFGLVFTAAFVVVGLWPLLSGHVPRYWALGVAAVFLLLTGLAPQVLRPLNILWGRFGALVHRVVAPLVMSAVFFLVVTPVAWIIRALGKDPLRLRIDQNEKSYWLERQPPGPDPQTMTRQF